VHELLTLFSTNRVDSRFDQKNNTHAIQ
jgi:hypothetical protein